MSEAELGETSVDILGGEAPEIVMPGPGNINTGLPGKDEGERSRSMEKLLKGLRDDAVQHGNDGEEDRRAALLRAQVDSLNNVGGDPEIPTEDIEAEEPTIKKKNILVRFFEFFKGLFKFGRKKKQEIPEELMHGDEQIAPEESS